VLALIVFALVFAIREEASYECYWYARHKQTAMEGLARQIEEVREGKTDSIGFYGPYADLQLRNLRHLNGLKVLYLDRTDASDKGMGYIRDIPDLRALRIVGCPQIGDRGIEDLAGHPNLENIVLDNTRVSDQGIAVLKRLPKLQTLTLWWDSKRSNSPITDKALASIVEIPTLTALYIGGDWHTKDAVKSLREKRPTLLIDEERMDPFWQKE
jgi:hypothetical protein